MTDSTVASLTAASALDGTELFYGVQGGADRKVTGAQLKTLVNTTPAFSGATKFTTSQQSISGAQFDNSGAAQYSVANGASTPIAPVGADYYMAIISETAVSGQAAIYLCCNSTVVLVFATAVFVASTTTPAGGKASIAWNGVSQYTVYNNFGSTATFAVTLIKMH